MASARFPLFRSIACLALVVATLATNGRAQGYGDGFDPNTDSNVYAMVRQPDGKVIVGGSFTLFEPDHYGNTVTRQRIARINRDGTIDATFTSYTDGDISALALQPDGKIVIAGKFTVVGDASGWQERTGIARLNTDGSLDTSFVQVRPDGFGYYPQAIIRTVAVQDDGRILIGGSFTSLQPDGSASPVNRSRLARLNADGTVDTSFDIAANNTVLALLIQPDGDIVLGGGFTKLRPAGVADWAAAPTRERIARLRSDGTLDTSFAPAFNNRVLALARQADGKILVAGEFTSITPVGVSTAQSAGFIARLNADGSHDSAFAPSASAAVESLSIQADGRIIIGGRFTWVRAKSAANISVYPYVARLFTDGALDTGFFPGANAPVTASIVQPDGTILIGGYFSTVGSSSGGSAARGRIARLQSDGTLDVAFRSASAGSVLAIAEEADGSMLVAGSYAAIGGVTRYSFSRVAPDGTISATFKPMVNGAIFALRVLSNGQILIGGSFSRVNGELSRYIARLNADGSRDGSFNPNPNATVYAITPQSDGKILVGGNFTSFLLNDSSSADPVTRRYLARLNTDGSVDDKFDPSPNLTVNSIVVQTDGKIIAGGDFYSLQPNGAKNATSYYYVARLNADGTPDDTFVPRPNASVSRVLLQSDGKVVICGSFTSVLPGKDTTATTRRYIARINGDGTLDTAFDPGPDAQVFSVDQFSDGRFIIHGAFRKFQSAGATTWTDRSYLAWLTASGSLDTTRVLIPDTTVSVSKVLSSGHAMVGSAFTRLTDGAGQVTLTPDLLVRVTSAGAIDTGFVLDSGDVGSSYVGALATQVGGKVYAAGSFAAFGGSANTGITRFYADGVPDNGFSTESDGTVHAVVALETSDDEEEAGGPVAWLEPGGAYRTSFDRAGSTQINGTVYTLAVQSDGKVLVGGEFSDATVTSTGNLVRLNADGAFDTTFNPEPNAAVQSVAVLSDGRIIIGGNFSTVGGKTQAYLARLLPNGTLDEAWAPTPNGTVLHVVPLSDGSIMVGGMFTTFKPNGATATVSRAYVARIKADGTVDTEFNPEVNGGVNRIVPLADGKLVLGGAFTTVKSKAREFLARVDSKGVLDTAFYPKPNGVVSRIAMLSSGGMVVAGEFSTFEPNDADTTIQRSLVARLNADGTVEENFHPFPNNFVEDVAVNADGSILLAGSFTAFRFEEGGTATRRNHLARFLSDGTLDPLFNPNANGTVNVVDARADGSMVIGGAFNQLRPTAVVIVGGEFANISESPMAYLARLNDDGSVDAFYTPRPDAPVRALAEQSSGSLLVAGDFANIDGAARAYLARLDTEGLLDPTFAPVIDGSVHALAVQADDRVLLGGEFTTVDGASRTRLARLLAGGAVDSAFAASADGRVSAIATQLDGRIVVGGAFTQVNGAARSYLARLNADGTLDSGFAPVLDGEVHALAMQADGRILVGGAFTQVGGTARSHLARLNADGTLDTTFESGADGAVRSLLVMADGRVVVGGAFGTLGSRNLLMLGRLANPTPAIQTATLDSGLSTFTWTSGGSSPLFSSVEIASSADGQVWTNVGNAILTSGGAWSLGGLTGLSSDAYNHIRARAVHASSPNGSVGRIEMFWAFYGSTPAGPATLLNSGGALAGWTGGYGGTGDGSGSGGSGGTGGSGGGSGGTGGGSGGGSGGTGGSGSSSSSEFHLVNLSVRAWPEDGQPFIAGLVLGGQSEGKVLMRAVGPGLARFGVDPVMTEPRMSIFGGDGGLLSTASSWTGDAVVAETATSVGAFALDPESDDSAIVRTLSPGNYTIHVDSGVGYNGVALGEVYFAGETGGMANFSARAPAGAGTAACIAGFVIGGDQPRRVLLRGVGPALLKYGVADAVPDPVLRVYDVDGVQVATNDNWQQPLNGSTAVEVASAAAQVGAFTLPVGGKDAAIVLELPPGTYTVHVGGAVAGTVLAEIYEIP